MVAVKEVEVWAQLFGRLSEDARLTFGRTERWMEQGGDRGRTQVTKNTQASIQKSETELVRCYTINYYLLTRCHKAKSMFNVS